MNKWSEVVVAIAYLIVVVFIVLFCASRAGSYDEFSQYWGLFGTIVGVVTGVIPSFFFKSQAESATQTAVAAEERATKACKRAELFAGIAPPDKILELRRIDPKAFE